MDSEDSTQKLLHAVLTDGSPLLPFGLVVGRQLRGSAALDPPGDDPFALVLELLRAIEEEDDPLPAKLLAGSPAVLASFFQNADLLPVGSPESIRLGALVLGAMEIASGEVRWP